ncbi:MAG: ABC transporter ATP-binding protein [Candidatus Dormiibacterota bacterium]
MKLEALAVSVSFGAVRALDGVSIAVEDGRRRGLIGPNGAGKTTLFNIIAGDIRADVGTVSCDDRDVTRWPGWRRAQLGLGRTFQLSTPFPELTVAENLALAVRRRRGLGWRFWVTRREAEVQREVKERLTSAGLAPLAERHASNLAHGERRALEFEQALALEPRALLLDEPMAGLSGAERHAAIDRLRQLPAHVSLLIIEHDLDFVFAVADDVTVLDHGVVVADGPAEEVRRDPRVEAVYLSA